MEKLLIADKTTWGSKALNLALMQEYGLPIPAFSVYRLNTFREATQQAYLARKQASYEREELSLEGLSETLQTWSRELVKAADFQQVSELQTDGLYSVRSSATVEDSRDTSFAGQFKTHLHVPAHQLREAIAEVVSSLYSLSSLSYLLHHNIDLNEAEMLVIVQEMIEGDVSGVYFTANPQGVLNEHIAVLGFGTGDQIVEDRVPTTTLTHYPMDQLTYFEVTEEANVVTSPIPTDAQISALEAMASQVNELFGPFMDIEFTFKDQQLYVLQARPITTFEQDISELEAKIILDNSNIIESYPGTTTPLTFSFIQAAYSSVFRGLAQRIVGTKSVKEGEILNAYEATFQDMIAMVNSRVYYQIQNWYQLLQLLPFSKKIIPVWQDMLGVRQTAIPQTPSHISGWQRVKVSFNILKAFKSAPKLMQQLDRDFQAIEQIYLTDYSSSASFQQLHELFVTLKEAVLDQWDITLVNDLYAFVFTGLHKHLNKKRPEAELELTGIEQIESMKPANELARLVIEIHQQPDYHRQLRRIHNNSHNTLIRSFVENDQHYLTTAIRNYIQQYGNRVPEELKLETATYQTHPELFIEALLNYPIEMSQESSRQLNYSTNGGFNPIRRYVREQALQGIRYRESSRLNRTRIYGMMRQIFLTMGQRLVESGHLKAVEDVFWLTLDELFALPDTKTGSANFIQQRKEKYQLDQGLPAVNRYLFVDQLIEKNNVGIHIATKQSNGETFSGIACSKGQIRAEVIKIDSIQAISPQDTRGKIIVTRMTDPGWVHLLTQASGIIAERGSMLSHTAIISRELGLPSIVNVSGIMAALETGDIVEMDGQLGTIRRVVKGGSR